MASSIFETYRCALIGKSVSRVWRGYGSALFLELGELAPGPLRDGKSGEPKGEFTLMIEWSWRIETETSILCGTWSEQDEWPDFLKNLVGRTIVDAYLFARLPEISLALTDNLYVSSFMTSTEQPAWVLFDRFRDKWINVENGKVIEESGTK